MIAAIIQARMGSKRLPGKVLKNINGVPLLKHLIDRVEKSKLLNKIVIATSISREDDLIEKFCRDYNMELFRGSEDDVLARFYHCAKKINADIIVRLTGDCPFSDPQIIDKVVQLFIDSKVDYAANTVPPETRKFPDGTDVEVFSMQALEKSFNEVSDLKEREHVTFYFWRNPNKFKTIQLDNSKNLADYRLTVDYPEDLEVASFIINTLKERKIFGSVEEIVNILDLHPEIKDKNSQYYFGMGWNK